MFKLKKILRKIYHFIAFLSLFIFCILPVHAYTYEEYTKDFQVAQTSCNDSLFYQSLFAGTFINSSTNYYQKSTQYSTSYLIPVEPSTTYTISFGVTPFYLYFFTSTTTNPQYINAYNSGIGTFNTSSNTTYIAIMIKKVPSTVPSSNKTLIKMYKGTTVPNDDVDPDYSCHNTNPKPDENNVYSNFLSLYTQKIEYLANGFTNNPYLLAMIGIIFSFIVLEITLKLFHMRGGKGR